MSKLELAAFIIGFIIADLRADRRAAPLILPAHYLGVVLDAERTFHRWMLGNARPRCGCRRSFTMRRCTAGAGSLSSALMATAECSPRARAKRPSCAVTRDRLLQRTVQLDDARVEAERRLAVAQDVLNRERLAATKAKKRSIAGTCPCCHRTFRQMALHMRNKHPEFKAEIAAA